MASWRRLQSCSRRRLAGLLLASAAGLGLSWVGRPSQSFCAAGPGQQCRPADVSPWQSASAAPDSHDAHAPAGGVLMPRATVLAAGGILMALTLAASKARRQGRGSQALLGRAAAEKEDMDLEKISKKYADEVKQIRRLCTAVPEDWDDVKVMRFAMQHPGDPKAAADNVKEVLAWRAGEGLPVVTAAAAAIAKATAKGGWDNNPVFEAAPHSSKVGKYITPKQMVVVSTKGGDLVTCIRAATIDSESLMKEVKEQEMVEFFLYAREVNTIIAEKRTRATGRVVKLISANDLTGVSKFPDSAFSAALTGSAKKAVTLYPGYSGPTVLLNLPWIARLLVSFLTPLFPGAVREKLKFARNPISYMDDLEDICKEPTKARFVADMQEILNT
mmetsp:Transcript_58743/g.95073  ORF Transcript_58743/g.95073 Transcript_58743/m.95073 type:complete len:388 (-) Transcript_58743:185-1348(-)